jgi:hypothetical protein
MGAGASAVDIITYVGIPLAVLGVLPTLYTCVKSILTLREIRRTLDRNGVSAITRSSLLSGIIEIELPRKSITPLDRDDVGYFAPGTRRSSLRGGSWTRLNWRELPIGTKGYRLQYHDELVQPQAEVEFEQLVAFLLDRGAVPSQEGFADLRGSGLWTPAGTKLLLSPRTADAVLSVATSEDSDGILSLALEWRGEWGGRSVADLPPYWMRLTGYEGSGKRRSLGFEIKEKEIGGERAAAPAPVQETEKTSKDPFLHVADEKPDFDPHRMSMGSHRTSIFSRASIYSHVPDHYNSNIRLRMGATGVEDIIFEDSPRRKFRARHLRSVHNAYNPSALWFSCAATALGAPQGGLWSFAIPDDILALSNLDSVPCGVLVLMGIVGDDAVPAWRTPYDDEMERVEKQHRFMERSRKMMEESRLPVAERQKVMTKRMQDEFREQQFENQKKRVEAEKRKAAEMVEALGSQRLGIAPIAEASRKWLVEKGYVGEKEGVHGIVEVLLWEMVRVQEVTAEVAKMLDTWKNWADNGGMTKAQFDFVKESPLTFAYAACILCLIKESGGITSSSVVSDLQECLRMWKRVRLG